MDELPSQLASSFWRDLIGVRRIDLTRQRVPWIMQIDHLPQINLEQLPLRLLGRIHFPFPGNRRFFNRAPVNTRPPRRMSLF